MSIVKSKQSGNFTVVPNQVFDSGLSIEAIGLLTFLLSLPHDWVVQKTKLHEQISCGKDKLDRVFKELQEARFIVSTKRNGAAGKMEHDHVVYDKPFEELPPPGYPHPEKPHLVNPELLNTDLTKETIQNTIVNNSLLSSEKPQIDFVELLKFINEKTGRQFRVIDPSVKRKFLARIREGYTKDDIASAIKAVILVKFHQENGFQYCTPEFFSRSETLSKYASKTGTVGATGDLFTPRTGTYSK